MNKESWIHLGPWAINAEWSQEWSTLNQEHFIFYSSPEAETRVIDEKFDARENKTDLAKDMLESIGVKVKD